MLEYLKNHNHTKERAASSSSSEREATTEKEERMSFSGLLGVKRPQITAGFCSHLLHSTHPLASTTLLPSSAVGPILFM